MRFIELLRSTLICSVELVFLAYDFVGLCRKSCDLSQRISLAFAPRPPRLGTKNPQFFVNILTYSLVTFVSFLFLGCGQHESHHHFVNQSGDIFKGSAPRTLSEKMQQAIDQDQIEEVKNLLQSGFDIDGFLPNGRTPLMQATVQSQFRMMAELLKLKANKEVQNAEGKVALDYAKDVAGLTEDGQVIITRAILLLDPERELEQRQNLLKYVRRGSADSILKLLKEVGINPNFLSEVGDTPLTLAVRQQKLASVSVLAFWRDCTDESLPSGCLRLTSIDLDLVDHEGRTALDLAQTLGRQDIVDVLREAYSQHFIFKNLKKESLK